MATSASGEFESALKRLEEIVGMLERENVPLDDSVALFKEGKGLAQKCERLLKSAQESIEAAARGERETPTASSSAGSAAGSASTQSASSASSAAPNAPGGPLFGSGDGRDR